MGGRPADDNRHSEGFPACRGTMEAPPCLGTLQDSMGVDNLDPFPRPVRRPEAQGDLLAGQCDRPDEGLSTCKIGRRRGGEGAPGPVKFLAIPDPAKAPHPPAVVEDTAEAAPT